jgi:putative membrane protein
MAEFLMAAPSPFGRAELGRLRVEPETLLVPPVRRKPMLAKFIVRAIFAALGLWLASKLVPGVDFTDTGSLILAAVLLGVVNALVRPVVFILTLPITIVTLGLFLLVVNAAMIGLVAVLLGGFEVHGLLAGIGAAIVTGVASWIGGMVLQDQKKR